MMTYHNHQQSNEKKCFQFEIKRIGDQRKWQQEEDSLLLQLAEKFKNRNWKAIASHFQDKSPLQCFSRFKRIRPGIVKGSWTKDEDNRILELVDKFGRAWSKISKLIGSRNGKQVRDRYINILDPTVRKEKFTLEEDVLVLRLHKQFGPRWAYISKYVKNRTADMIKNRFHSSIKRNIKLLEEAAEGGNFIDLYENNPTPRVKLENKATPNSSEDRQNVSLEVMKESSSTSTEYDIYLRRPIVECMIQRIIDLEYVKERNVTNDKWSIEDYFNL